MIQPLQPGSGAAIDRYDLGLVHRLFIGRRPVDRAELIAAAMAGWNGSPTAVSRSSTGTLTGMLVARAHRAGLDIETIARVAANTRIDDAWLSKAELAQIADAVSPTLEIACRWVLKEAYGKALGVGLALPLAGLSFGVGPQIMLTGAAAPPVSDGWMFELWRRDDALIATAIQSVPSDNNAVRAGRQKTAHPIA